MADQKGAVSPFTLADVENKVAVGLGDPATRLEDVDGQPLCVQFAGLGKNKCAFKAVDGKNKCKWSHGEPSPAAKVQIQQLLGDKKAKTLAKHNALILKNKQKGSQLFTPSNWVEPPLIL